MNFYENVIKVLKADDRFFTQEGEFLRNTVYEAAMQMDSKLIKSLYNDPITKEKFFTEIDGIAVFDKVEFGWVINNRQFLPDSYTRYKNKIGLVNNRGEYIATSNDVELVFPYKDCVLEGGQTKEEQKRDEIFYNETLVPDEIDRLLAPKVFTNIKRLSIEKAEIKTENTPIFRENDNIIIRGNNLSVLSSLLRKYNKKVKLIYIDPPYNTGNDGFGYNDKFNHSSWLVFMKNRIILAKELLREDGVIFIQCDDTEQAYLKVLLDEIFGIDNYLSTIAYQRSGVAGLGQGGGFVVNVTEYITVFAYNKSLFKAYNLEIAVPLEPKHMKRYNAILKDKGTKSLYLTFISKSTHEEVKIYKHQNFLIEKIQLHNFEKRENEIRKIYNDNFNHIFRLNVPQEENTFQWNIINSFEDDELYSVEYLVSRGKSKGKIITNFYWKKQLFAWLNTDREGIAEGKTPNVEKTNKMSDFWTHGEIPKADLANEGSVQLKRGKKPEQLLKRIIDISTKQGDLVLDFFLGSGTTAAVAHKMKRQYIGIEQLDYGDSDCLVRLKNVIAGDSTGISKAVNWQGGGSFVYCELAKLNQNYVERIEKAKDEELIPIWEEIKKTGFISYKVNPRDIDENIEDFKALSSENKKRLLMELLDKNQLYINYCDIDDESYAVSDVDKAFTKSFYGED